MNVTNEQPGGCVCGERFKDECPGAWEPGCDLGSNAKYAKAAPLYQDVLFEAWWAGQVEANGGHIGADYKHWARLGWMARKVIA